MAYFFVEGSRTSCTVIVMEFLLKFLYNKISKLPNNSFSRINVNECKDIAGKQLKKWHIICLKNI
jgi:hypothetical protein